MDGSMTSRTGPGSRAGGEMGALIRAHDWSITPLGPSTTWPQSLKTAVNLMLQARQPAYIAWGPEQISFYNDGYIPILGTKHPAGLGQPAAMLWAEIWDTLGPINAAVLSGEAQWFEDMPFALAGRERELSWFSFSYTPLLDDNDRIAGIFCVAQETTDKVLAERRAGAERQRLTRMFEQAPELRGTARRARASVRARQPCLSPVGRAPRGPGQDHSRGAPGRCRAGLSRSAR